MKYKCTACGYIYDDNVEAVKFEDLPDDWVCPLCGLGKEFFEKIEEFRTKGADVAFGAFGENLIVEGYDFKNLPVGTRFRCGKVLLEMTQIGKECHSHCQIYQRMGECIMPHEGVFAVVLEGGTIHVGDELLLQES